MPIFGPHHPASTVWLQVCRVTRHPRFRYPDVLLLRGAVVTIVSYQMSPQVSTMILRSGVKVTGLDVGDAGSCPHLHTAADITAPPLVTPSLGPHWSRPGSRDPRQPITAPDEIGVKSWLAVDGDLFAASL